jgi:microcystin degradation protein MlrC
VTDGDERLARELADKLAHLCWSVRKVAHPSGNTPSEAIQIARRCRLRRRFGAILFSDVCDAVGAGAPGENTWILKSLIEEGSDLISYSVIRDKEATEKAFGLAEGATVTLTVGGKLETEFNRPLEITGTIIRKSEDNRGKIVLLKNRGVHVALTEVAEMAWKPAFWSDLGLNAWDADIIVAKSIYHFRWFYLLYNRKTVFVITPGTTAVDVFNLKFRNMPRPIYPFDDIDSWRQA